MRVPQSYTPRTSRASGELPFIRQVSQPDATTGAALGQSLMRSANALGSVGDLINEQAQQARRFGVLQNFSAFQATVDTRLAELKRDADPALGNFADQATAHYANWEHEWLATVPDEFYDEFKTRAADVKARIARESLAFQYERTDAFFRQGVDDQVNASLLSLDQDGSLENLDRQRGIIGEAIASTGLTEAEKVARLRQASIQIESVSYKSEVRRQRLEIGALGVGSAPGSAVDLIREFDGPSLENGLDYETNNALLEQRVQEAEAGALAAVGSTEQWGALPSRARAAIISLYDDLGELPPSVVEAINEGDLISVAGAVEALGGERREAEAEIILGTGDMPDAQLDADPRFANIPYEDRLVLRADAEREAAALQKEQQRVAKAQKDAAINQLMVDILDGRAGQWHIDQAREEGWLDDYEAIKRAQDALAKRDSDLASVQLMQEMLAAGQTINPALDEDRKMFNAWVGEEGIAAMRQLDQGYVANVLVPAVRTAGDLPTETVGLLTSMTRSQNPQAALFALDALSQLQQASPEAYEARVTEALQADVRYWQTVKDYYPEDEVLDAVRGGTTQEARVRNEMLRKEAKGLVSDGTVKFDPVQALGDNPVWRWGDPSLTVGQSNMISSDFNQLFEREYARDGNAEAAKQRATEALGRIWQVTDIGGQQQLMRYPPELFNYPTWDGSYDWITQQGREELGLEAGQNFQLVSDEQTRSEFQAWQAGTGPRPSYLVTYRNEEGQLDYPRYVEGDAEVVADPSMLGQPKRIFFEVTPEMQEAKAQEFEREKLRQQRDAFMLTFGEAQRHSLETGIPIPQELLEEFYRWGEVLPRGY